MAAGFLAGHAAVSQALPVFCLSLCAALGLPGWGWWFSVPRPAGFLVAPGGGLEAVAAS